MIKAFTLGLIMGAVIGTAFGVLIMACVQAGRDYLRNQRECPKFGRKQSR